MFDRPRNNAPAQPAASEVARIQGGGLAQVIVTSLDPMTFFVFLNDREIPQAHVESLYVEVSAPPTNGHQGGTIVTAVLSHRITAVTGERVMEQTALFPCTLELVALGRRIVVVCTQEGSLEGLWIQLGMKPDGSANEVGGAQALRILLNERFLDAKLTWNDGQTEDLLPTG